MSIGDVLDAIEKANPSSHVKFDFGGICPKKICSWRGSYDEASIEFGDGTHCQESTTVEQFKNELLQSIDGRLYTGWKGGEYAYTRKTPLHVDNHGNYSNTEIVRVEVDEYQVVLHTEYQP